MYIENLKDSPSPLTHKPLELTNEFGKVTGYKVNIKKKSTVFLDNK